MKPATREWVEKAEADLGTAERESHGPNPDAVAFHAQQCAEKYIKAVLCETDIRFARVHDLFALVMLIDPPSDALLALRREMESLTACAVEARYPGLKLSANDAASALRTAREVRAICRRLLDLDAA